MRHFKLKSIALAGAALAALLLFNSQAEAARGDAEQLYQGQSIDDMVIQYMQQNHIPGMAMAIVQAPYIPRVVGYGLADTQNKRLVASNTVFPLGQMTNGYTAVAIMQLVEAGKIKLDAPVSTYLPHLPKSWQEITVKQLFTHTSGLPNYTQVPGFDAAKPYTFEQIIQSVQDKPMAFKAGTEAAYSATDYYLLAHIIDKTSGMSYEDYVKKNQFERVHLEHTFFLADLNKIDNETRNGTQPFKHSKFKEQVQYINPTEPVVGYTEQANGQSVAVPANQDSALYGDANIAASAEDVSLWDIALAGDILVKDAKDRDFLYHGIALNNGKMVPANANWQFPGHPGLMYIEGHVPGATAFLSRFTAASELLCVTLLTNQSSSANLAILGRKVAGAYDIKLGPPTGATWTVSRESPYSVEETLARFSDVIKQQGGTVFATIDHSANAGKAGQKLRPMQVLVIGNPSKGTALLEAQSTIGADLPLRVMAWQDAEGQVWLSFTNPIVLGKEYKVQGQDKLLAEMYAGLSHAAKTATSAY